jgi:hypothetical protein
LSALRGSPTISISCCARRVAARPLAMWWTRSGSESIEPIVIRGFSDA